MFFTRQIEQGCFQNLWTPSLVEKNKTKFFQRTHQQVEERKYRISKYKFLNIRLKYKEKRTNQKKLSRKYEDTK